jgi:DNA-binding NarL/FixJ family response regulator
MILKDAVDAALAHEPAGTAMSEALRLVREELMVDRISLHAINEGSGTFRVIADAGDPILSEGTELPLETTTQVRVPALGEIFSSSSFVAAEGFDHPLDNLVCDLGFRSGCSVPLLIGTRSVGGLCISSREEDLDCQPLVAALNEISPSITLAMHAAHAPGPGRILICHDDPLVAEGLARILESSLAADVQIVSTTDEALEQSSQPSARIDTVVCDSFFAGQRVDNFLRALRSGGTAAPALVVASSSSSLGRSLALRGGAAGYVLRADGPQRIVEAVKRLRAGEASGFAGSGAAPDADDDVTHFTAQEARLLLLLERGLRFKQIALRMGISESTAKGYARNLFAKLHVHSRGEAVFEARRQGMLELLGVEETASTSAVSGGQ